MDLSQLTDEQIMAMAAPPVKPEDVAKATQQAAEQASADNQEGTQGQDQGQNAGGDEGQGDENQGQDQSTQNNQGEDQGDNTSGSEDAGKDTSDGGNVSGNADGNDKGKSDAVKTDASGNPVKDETTGGKDTSQGGNASTAESGKDAAQVIDYKANYELLMAPFVANGKTIKLNDPKEAIQLMQMGANYTSKMQALAPVRKHLLTLQNNNLLNEKDISFFIDLKNKNPEAIKKLLKDSGIDPRDIDVESGDSYQPGNHTVSDAQVTFSTVLEDVSSTAEGQKTIQLMTGWDQASKDALWGNPQIMTAIHQQRQTGVYDLINAEVERRQMLGQIPQGTPFLTAYKAVGDEMAEAAKNQGGNQTGSSTGSTTSQKSEPLTTRTAAPKSQVANGAKANAASSTRTTASKATAAPPNPLAMSDEEFLKLDQFAGKI